MIGLTRRLLVTVVLSVWAAVPSLAEDFTFVHATDVHTPMPQSRDVIGKLKGVGEVDLTAYGLKVPKPSFAIVTGDLTEFGGGSGWWDEYLSYWSGIGFPAFHCLGNHDNTWHANINALRKLGLGPYYSFEEHGSLFICLNSAGLQDPRPSFGEEQILWLRKTLAKVSKDKPVYVFYHHPLQGSEFASPYDWQRLLDVLRPYNVVLMMAGHYHSVQGKSFLGVNEIIGGTTFGKNAGYTFVSVKDGMVRAAYQRADKSTPDEKMIEFPLPSKSSYPVVSITSPRPYQAAKGKLQIVAELQSATVIPTKAEAIINDTLTVPLEMTKGNRSYVAKGEVDLATLLPGSHYVRVEFSELDKPYARSTTFIADNGQQNPLWKTYLGAGSKATPVISGDRIFIGANDGQFWALDRKTGQSLWSIQTGAEILTTAAVDRGKVYFANGAGTVYAYDVTGKKIWETKTDDAVYSSPVIVGQMVVFGSNSGKVFALSAKDGSKVWENSDAQYSVEAPLTLSGGRIYYGAWDQYVRCLNSKGELVWKTMGEGANKAPAAKRYYSPGDAQATVAGWKVFIADRAYTLSIMDTRTGALIGTREKVSATSPSEDKKSVYLRELEGNLTKIDLAGNVLWSVPAEMGAIPTPITEHNGTVYACSGKGKVSAFSSQDGKLLWQYQASPGLFVMAGLAADDDAVYVASYDGFVTAIAAK